MYSNAASSDQRTDHVLPDGRFFVVLKNEDEDDITRDNFVAELDRGAEAEDARRALDATHPKDTPQSRRDCRLVWQRVDEFCRARSSLLGREGTVKSSCEPAGQL